MERDIEILEILVKNKRLYIKNKISEAEKERVIDSVENLIQAYKEDETQINKLKRQAKMTAEEHEKVFNLIDKIIDLMLDDLDINDHGREVLFRSYEDRATEILKKREEKQ